MGKIKRATCIPNHRGVLAWATQNPLAASKDEHPHSEDKNHASKKPRAACFLRLHNPKAKTFILTQSGFARKD